MAALLVAGPVTAAPSDLPDLDLATQATVSLDHSDAPADGYYQRTGAWIIRPAATYHPPAPVAVTLSTPLILFHGDAPYQGVSIGDLTIAVQTARRLSHEAAVGAGAAWTLPTASFAGAAVMASQLAGDSYRYFDGGHVAQLHGDLRWHTSQITAQLQVGVEDYVISDWPDQLLVRVGAALTVHIRRVDASIAGVVLTDRLDEQYDEGADAAGAVTGALAAPAALIAAGAVAGLHATAHLGSADRSIPPTSWTMGVDLTIPVTW